MASYPIVETSLAYILIAGGLGSFAVSMLFDSSSTKRFDAGLVRCFIVVGLPLTVGLMVLNVLATWANADRLPAFAYEVSVGGLAPFSDAANHFSCAHQQATQGRWYGWCDRRPLASAMRVIVTMLGGYDYNIGLIVQAVLLGGALFIAALRIGRSYGACSMLVFTGIAILQIRPFVVTTLSEPLGAMLALLAVAATADALRRNDLYLNAGAIGLLSFALLVRMGAMFMIPILLLWGAIGHRSWRQALMATAAAALAIALVFGTSRAVVSLYGNGQNQSGSNFSYSLYGLSVGSDWSEAERRHGRALVELPTEAERAAFLYRKALDNILADPRVIGTRLWQGLREFVQTLPSFMLTGYRQTPLATPWWAAFYVIAVFGLIVNRKDFTRGEVAFLILVPASTAASAPFVIFDDGWRVLIVSHLTLAMALAMALRRQGTT